MDDLGNVIEFKGESPSSNCVSLTSVVVKKWFIYRYSIRLHQTHLDLYNIL